MSAFACSCALGKYFHQVMGLAKVWASQEGLEPSYPISEMEQAEKRVREAFEERFILRQVMGHTAESVSGETLFDI